MSSVPASCNGSKTAERDRLERRYADRFRHEPHLSGLVSYVGNKKMPILRLFRYKEAFASEFVRHFLRRFNLGAADLVFDPFAGMGTTLFSCWLEGIPSVGTDRLPVAAFVAQTLPKFIRLRCGTLAEAYERLHQEVEDAEPAHVAEDVKIMALAFPESHLARLRQWKAVIGRERQPLKDVLRLLLYSILEETSFTSKDGQFLRLNRAGTPVDPDVAFRRKCRQAEEDLWALHNGMLGDVTRLCKAAPKVVHGDARTHDGIADLAPFSALITSPPYVNRYDYTRTYCLELCFGFVRDFAELRALRHSLLRSHIESQVAADERPPHSAIAEVVDSLAGHALNNPRIPQMLTAYFADMAEAIAVWSRVLGPGAQAAVVVDNVRFHGEHVPVDLVLSELAEQSGFETEEIAVARYKGNSSQQMGRYGRFPVRESILIWRKR